MQKRINWWWVGAGVLILIFIGMILVYFNYNQMVVKVNKSKGMTDVVPTATPTPDPLAPYSILLLGYGGGTHDGGKLTDSIMLAQIRPRDEIVKLISIPRDLWVPIPISGTENVSKKINEAYIIGLDDKKYPDKKAEFTGEAGGGELSKYTVEQATGIKPDYFAAIDFDGFTKIIDSLGGIDVKITQTFDDPFYPIEELKNETCGKSEEEVKSLEATMSGDKLEQQYICRYESLHFDKGLQHLDGVAALKFARSRHSTVGGGDFNRAERQKIVVTAIRDKIINIGFVSKIIPTIQTLTRHITTDVDFSKMSELVTKIPEVSSYKIVSIALTDTNVLKNAKATTGQFILSPKLGENDFSEVKKFIESNGILTITPTATVSPAIK
ncbi:MAG: LCP family protein [Candidatus Shapirobacteria bacterium]|nr:LCP family protein [Candidatus Shapirobacteria bacterium]